MRRRSKRRRRIGRPRKTRKTRRRRIKRAPVPRTVLLSRDLRAKHDRASEWMILALNGDDEETHSRYDLIEAEILRVFGENVEFFIPSFVEKVKDRAVGMDLMTGYVFVQRTAESETAFVENPSPYFKCEMRSGSRSDVIKGDTINGYKKKLLEEIKGKAPKKGDTVIPKVGTFKSMEGTVVSVSKDRRTATVIFKRASRIVQAPVSVLNIETVTKDTRK